MYKHIPSYTIVSVQTSGSRTTATLHHTLVLGHIATEPLFLIGVPAPSLLEGIEVEFHDLRQNFALAFLFDTLNEFVEDPGAGDELVLHVSAALHR
jgi:hypothetical protein